ncbi:hypothetical protein R5R35_000761 [Gryllus longicercus]|uniref:Uncharacterized protein n=1 Tax=Gryllus longicercus TaxID=2509291 RepID=A0AAN9VSG3_9ORTH
MPRTSRPERRAFVLISPPATRVRQLAACACPLSWLAVRRHRTGALRARSRRRQRPPPRYVSPEGAPPPSSVPASCSPRPLSCIRFPETSVATRPKGPPPPHASKRPAARLTSWKISLHTTRRRRNRARRAALQRGKTSVFVSSPC